MIITALGNEVHFQVVINSSREIRCNIVYSDMFHIVP